LKRPAPRRDSGLGTGRTLLPIKSFRAVRCHGWSHVQPCLSTRGRPQRSRWSRCGFSHLVVGHAKRSFKKMSPRVKHTLTAITCAVLGSGLVAAPAAATIGAAAPLPFPGISCNVNQGFLPGIPNFGPTGPLGPLGSEGPLGGAGNLPCGLSVLNLGPTGPLGPGGQLGPSSAPAPQPASAAPAATTPSSSTSALAAKATPRSRSKSKSKSKSRAKTKSKARRRSKSRAGVRD
jgi:hypothetical protein